MCERESRKSWMGELEWHLGDDMLGNGSPNVVRLGESHGAGVAHR